MRTLKEVIDDMKEKGAYTLAEAGLKCPELLKEYTEIIKEYTAILRRITK